MMEEDFRKEIHTLRNQLNNISMQSELAKFYLEEGADMDQVTAALDKVAHNCAKSSQTLEHIVDIASKFNS